jgi:hypothetical protein
MSDEAVKEQLSLADLVSIYETRWLEIARNADEIIKRRLSGEIVDKSETENQELLMKDLLRMEKAIKHLKKISGKEDLPEGPVSGQHQDRALAKVKDIKSSIARIEQKIS